MTTSPAATPATPATPATQPPHARAQAAADRLFELCNSGRFMEAMHELYAEDARHVEPIEMPGSPFKRVIEGKEALLKMSELWNKSTTVHSAACGRPLLNGDQFICEMTIDCTSTDGPMAGQRMQMREYCLYTVNAQGKIAEARFFYPACGM